MTATGCRPTEPLVARQAQSPRLPQAPFFPRAAKRLRIGRPRLVPPRCLGTLEIAMFARLFLVIAFSSALVACSSKTTALVTDASAASDVTIADGTVTTDVMATDVTAATADSSADTKTDPALDCDPLGGGHCAMPWPSDWFLAANADSPTGFNLQFGSTSLARNIDGTPLDPSPYNKLDGYSWGTPLLMVWPGLDPTNLADEGHVADSLAADAPIVWLELDGKGQYARRVAYFTELDRGESNASVRTLIVRPAEILKPATQYAIGVRKLQDKSGKLYPQSQAFADLLAGKTAGKPMARRQARSDTVVAALTSQGVTKESLQLAWGFVTASDAAEHAALLSMRTAAFAATGDQGPKLTVTEVKTYSTDESVEMAMQISGTMHVPRYLTKATVHGSPIEVLQRDAKGVPQQNGWDDREFFVRIPRVALAGVPQGLVQYGHGLNGHALEMDSGYIDDLASQNNLIFYACHMRGMSQFDVPSILLAVNDMDQIVTMFDKLQQSMIEWLLLQRAMQKQLGQLPALVQNKVTVDPSQMYYFGNSQGGIFGGTVVALSQDVTRGDLGVPGNNYDLLLQRSKDFEVFFQIIAGNFPDSREQAVLLATIQLLWDATDPITHYRHLNLDPYPGTPSHQVLMDIAKGDHQVAPVANEILARSNLGVALMANWGRPVAGVKETAYPVQGSGMISWDFGNPWANYGNAPPDPGDNGPCAADGSCAGNFSCNLVAGGVQHCTGNDPHGLPRKSPHHGQQMVHFFRTGEIIDVCGGDGCHNE